MNSKVVFLGLISACSLSLFGCTPTDVTKSGVTWDNKGYSRSNPAEKTIILRVSGQGKDQGSTRIESGLVYFDRYNEVAFHIYDGRQNAIFTSRKDQGSEVDDAIEFSAKGAMGKANVAIVFSFNPTDESMGEFIRQYRKDDQDFAKTEFRQSIQQEMVKIMRDYDPVQAVEKQDEIAGKLQNALQGRYGKMISIINVGFTDRFVFSESVNRAIAEASEAKAQEGAIQAQKDLLKKQSELRAAQKAAFGELTNEQREYELRRTAIEKGMNIYQPQIVSPK
ncbi:MAG: SPFH domain-containing protein [Patescibacteria group bacterium]